MGSSKKHKEKKDKKKHKKHRSRSRERDSHKKSHKSSHRKDKHKSPDTSEVSPTLKKHDEIKKQEIPISSPPTEIHAVSDEEFDVDKLLDSKLAVTSESPNVVQDPIKKRKREDAVEELKRRLNFPSKEGRSEDLSSENERNSQKRIKREDRFDSPTDSDPKLSLSISETNKIRAKLGLKPLDVKKESSVAEPKSSIDSSKSRERESIRKIEMTVDDTGEQECHLSLNVSETNKLRAKLGLKPLEEDNKNIPGIDVENEEKEISKQAAEVFVKTENISEKKKSEALRDKLKVMKEKRQIEDKLKKTKGIADSDSEDESAASWVVKHQKVIEQKEAAEKRAKMLEEMDAEFGIGSLVDEEFDKAKAYTSDNLKGLKIMHDVSSFSEGQQVILTLKDKGVLEEEEDILENVNFVDRERYARNVENLKKKPDYRPYEEPEYDEFGILQKKSLLSKYDEEIEGEKKKSFKIGEASHSSYVNKEQELELIRMKLRQQNQITLEMPAMKVANEYYTPEDMVLFKKPKKKRKVKKIASLKADDLLPDSLGGNDLGSRRNRRQRVIDDDDEDEGVQKMNVDSIPFIGEESMNPVDVSDVIDEDDEAEKELYSALNKAKKLKERKIMATAPEKVIEILNSVGGKPGDSKHGAKAVNIEMNSVAEFCRTLGDIPTYGMSGNRDEEVDDMMDLERELLEEQQRLALEAQNRSAWNEVDIEEKPVEILGMENLPILEEEPDITTGVAGALNLATKKGYLDKEAKKAANATKTSTLQAQSYTIEEKFYEDDKFGKRDRYTGPVQDFREKNNYKPEVKLEYIDDSGRLLSAKEAFRYLSHKFHGKGPGKNKVDKRMKKLDQDNRLKQMSSTDTPLNTVKLLQAKQRETQSPYIVLSGGNKTLTQTMISKVK